RCASSKSRAATKAWVDSELIGVPPGAAAVVTFGVRERERLRLHGLRTALNRERPSVGRPRRWRESDEDAQALPAGVPADGVDIKSGLPVVERPNVAGLIDAQRRLTHHRDEAGRLAWTVQRISIVEKHLATCRGHGVARRRRVLDRRCSS